MIISREKSACVGAAEAGNAAAAADAVTPANYSINNSKSGHGIMAEEAQTMIDRLRGKSAFVVGRDNAKNGADRLVDGTRIQTKFYNSGKGCVAACFDSDNGGTYRYINDDGSPMPVEVPKDMYSDALKEFRLRISKGKVPGVSDESRAEEFVRPSDLTYDQSVALCAPLTRESLLYDCAVGFLRCFVLSVVVFAAAFVSALRGGRGKAGAAKSALKCGGGAFGLSYITHIICSQFARTALFKALPFPEIEKSRAVLAFDAAVKTGAGGGFTSMSGAVNRFPKVIKTGLLASMITLILFLALEVFSLIRGKSNFAEFKLNVLIILFSKITAAAFYFCAAFLLASMLSLPFVLNVSLCALASVAGGMCGRGAVFKLLSKIRI